MTITENIDNILHERGMSRRQLAIAAGIPTSSFQAAMARGKNMTIEMLISVARALDVNPADLDESLAINLGSDVIYQQPDGSFIPMDSRSDLGHAASILTGLNKTGKQEWLKRGDELLQIPQYKKESPEE